MADPITETRYELSHPTGTLYTPSLTVATAAVAAGRREHPTGKFSLTEIVEARRALPLPVCTKKPAKAKTRRAKKAKEA